MMFNVKEKNKYISLLGCISYAVISQNFVQFRPLRPPQKPNNTNNCITIYDMLSTPVFVLVPGAWREYKPP